MRLSILDRIISSHGFLSRGDCLTWETDLKRYEKEHLALQSAHYQEDAARYLRAVAVATGKAPQDLTKKDLAAFFAERDLAPASIKAIYAIIKAGARWLNEGETPRHFPKLKELARITPSDTLRVKRASELLTPDEFEALCAALSPRDETITRLIRSTGCRPGEILGLRRGDVTWTQEGGEEYCVLALPTTKKGQPRASIVFDRKAADKLREYMTIVAGDALFPAPRGEGSMDYRTYWRSLKRGAERAGIAKRGADGARIGKRVYGYLFRHAFASDEGARLPPAERDEQLGWSSPMYTRYTHLAVTQRLKTAARFAAGRPAPAPDAAKALEDRMVKMGERAEKIEALLKGILTRPRFRKALADEGIWNLEGEVKALGWGAYLEGDGDEEGGEGEAGKGE